VNSMVRLTRAELSKVLGRSSGLVGLAVAVLVAVLAVAVVQLVEVRSGGSFTQGAGGAAELIQLDLQSALGGALRGRNFFVLPLVLLMVTGQLIAGEFDDRTLRAALVRPVRRSTVLAAKIAALGLYAALTLLLTWGTTLVLGLLLLGPEGLDLLPVTLGFAVSWLSDLGLILLGAFFSVRLRSVVGVVVGTVLLLMLDKGLWAALSLLGSVLGEAWALTAVQWLPGTALAAWEGWQTGFESGPFFGLAGLLLVGGGLAFHGFARLDVP